MNGKTNHVNWAWVETRSRPNSPSLADYRLPGWSGSVLRGLRTSLWHLDVSSSHRGILGETSTLIMNVSALAAVRAGGLPHRCDDRLCRASSGGSSSNKTGADGPCQPVSAEAVRSGSGLASVSAGRGHPVGNRDPGWLRPQTRVGPVRDRTGPTVLLNQARRMRDSNSRGVAPNTLSKRAP